MCYLFGSHGLFGFRLKRRRDVNVQNLPGALLTTVYTWCSSCSSKWCGNNTLSVMMSRFSYSLGCVFLWSSNTNSALIWASASLSPFICTCPTWRGSQTKFAVYRASNDTLTSAYSLFTQLLWTIFCASLVLSFLVSSTPGGIFTPYSIMSCTTQDLVNQLCLFGPGTNGFMFNVRIMLSGRCIWTSQCRLHSQVSMQHIWAQVASFCKLQRLQDT